jgi:hypothetical protein
VSARYFDADAWLVRLSTHVTAYRLYLQDSSGQLGANLCVMLAEAAAKAAEHAALLHVLQAHPPVSDEQGPADEEQVASVWSFRAADTPGFVPLLEARNKAGKPLPKLRLLLAQAHVGQLAHKQHVKRCKICLFFALLHNSSAAGSCRVAKSGCK